MSDQQRFIFTGTGGPTECQDFIRFVRQQAVEGNKPRDGDWIVDYAASCITGSALEWFEELDEEVSLDWKLLRRALLAKYGHNGLESSVIPTPAVAPPAAPPTPAIPPATPAATQSPKAITFPAPGASGGPLKTPGAKTKTLTERITALRGAGISSTDGSSSPQPVISPRGIDSSKNPEGKKAFMPTKAVQKPNSPRDG